MARKIDPPAETPAELTPEQVAQAETDRQSRMAFNLAILNAETPEGHTLTDEERTARRQAKSALLDDETPKERFKRLSQARLNGALDQIYLIGNLSGANYEYTQGQIDFIRSKIISDTEKMIARFKPKVKGEKEVVEIPED